MIDWRNDPRTMNEEQLAALHPDARREIGHYFNGPDGFVYRLVAWRKNDGPWIEEVGRGATRTISSAAISRTFHHHRLCPCDRRWFGLNNHKLGELANGFEWSNTVGQTDGFTLWLNTPSEVCLGRLSAVGAEVYDATGEQLLWSAPGKQPEAQFASFHEAIAFERQMVERHGVGLSQAIPLRLRADP